MSQLTSLLAGSALGRQTCFVKYNISLSACSAPGQQTCQLAHEDFCLKNWAIDLGSNPIFARVFEWASFGRFYRYVAFEIVHSG
jgi:hypothetical protein